MDRWTKWVMDENDPAATPLDALVLIRSPTMKVPGSHWVTHLTHCELLPPPPAL